jgi:hypothetical protein
MQCSNVVFPVPEAAEIKYVLCELKEISLPHISETFV